MRQHLGVRRLSQRHLAVHLADSRNREGGVDLRGPVWLDRQGNSDCGSQLLRHRGADHFAQDGHLAGEVCQCGGSPGLGLHRNHSERPDGLLKHILLLVGAVLGRILRKPQPAPLPDHLADGADPAFLSLVDQNAFRGQDLGAAALEGSHSNVLVLLVQGNLMLGRCQGPGAVSHTVDKEFLLRPFLCEGGGLNVVAAVKGDGGHDRKIGHLLALSIPDNLNLDRHILPMLSDLGAVHAALNTQAHLLGEALLHQLIA